MATIHLSLNMARRLHLAAQGLLNAPRRLARPEDLLAAIHRMALLQIDSINVVARSPYLVLFSRIGPYPTTWLDACLERGELYEYWAHEACFVPIEDYGLLRHRMLDPSGMGWKDPQNWLEQHRDEVTALLQHVEHHGPVRAADFARAPGKSNGWWDWKPEKKHLEALFTQGHLMVARRHQFQRVYDLRDRVLPHWDDARDLPSKQQVTERLLERSCRALGIVKASWVADYYRQGRADYAAALAQLADAGVLIPARVEGWTAQTYVHHSLGAQIQLAEEGRLHAGATRILSPFDPVVWDRRRVAELFDFDYRIECYTPAAQRRFGYFVLPILSRGRLVGRLDAKAHRAQGIFEIKALYLEPGVRVSQRLGDDLSRALQALANWHGTAKLTFSAQASAIASALGLAREAPSLPKLL